MAKRPSIPKVWTAITNGNRQGEYEVSGGTLTVRSGSRQKSTRASSTGVPSALGADADKALAMFMLGELV